MSSAKLQLVEGELLNSFCSRDVKRWQEQIKTKEATTLFSGRGSKFRDKLFKEIQSTDMSKCDETTLGQIRSMIQGLLQTALKSDRRMAISVERCVIACQVKAPHDAVELAREALLARIQLKPQTLTSTINRAVNRAKTPEDLTLALGLAKQVAANGVLSIPDSGRTSSFNVMIAVMCDPAPYTQVGKARVGTQYQVERSLSAVLERMTVGAGFAELVVSHRMPFNSKESEGRINTAVRGIVTAAMGLFHMGASSNDEISAQQSESMVKLWGLDKLYTDLKQESDLCPEWRAISSHLLYKSLEVVKHCFNINEDGSSEWLYKLHGETLSRLVYALEESKTELSEERKDTLSEIMFGGLSIALCHQQISSRCMHTVLRLLNSPDSLPARRAALVAPLLLSGLDKVGCTDLLEEMSNVLEISPQADDDLRSLFTLLRERIAERINQLRVSSDRGDGTTFAPETFNSNQSRSGWLSQLLDNQPPK